MNRFIVHLVVAVTATSGICHHCLAAPLTVTPISREDFSGSESVVPFSQSTPLLDSFTVDGITFTNQSGDGFILVQTGGLDSLFGNIPGASLGSYGRTTAAATVSTRLLIDLPSPARRFGMLLTSGVVSTWSVTALSDQVGVLGSITATMPGSTQTVFAGLHSTIPFDQVLVTEAASNGQNDAFDDIRFEIVPETRSFTIATLAFLLLLTSTRKIR